MGSETPTDRSLVRRLRGGDRAALGLLYDRHAAGLRAFAVGRLGGPGADEVVQEVFLSLLERPPRRSDSVAGWLYTAVRNRCTSRLRRRTTRLRAVPALRAVPPRSDPAPDDQLRSARRLARIRAALDDLPPEQREALLLKQAGGLTYAEIGALQGVPEGTVKSRLHAASAATRAALARSGDDLWTPETAAT